MSEVQKILIYFSTWPSGSGLANGSVRPTLEAISDRVNPDSIIYVSVESTMVERPLWLSSNIKFEPIIVPSGNALIARTRKTLTIIHTLRTIVKLRNACILLSRGAPAGGIASLAAFNLQCDQMVESFEPHANYMVSAKIWPRYGLRNIISLLLEVLTLRQAKWIAVVSRHFQKELLNNKKTHAEIVYVPCVASRALFSFDAVTRSSVRHELNLDEKFVLVYVGKFGGLYLERSAFRFMAAVARRNPSVFFVIISPSEQAVLATLAKSEGLSTECYVALSSPHAEVANYLCAADLGLGFHRATDASYAFSPIKYAEYWAAGLPVVAPMRVGSESNEIEARGLGISIDFRRKDAVDKTLFYIDTLKNNPIDREAVCVRGVELRDPRILEKEIEAMLNQFSFKPKEGNDD